MATCIRDGPHQRAPLCHLLSNHPSVQALENRADVDLATPRTHHTPMSAPAFNVKTHSRQFWQPHFLSWHDLKERLKHRDAYAGIGD
eukprot:2940776-Rhodomonas_salina.5